VSAFLPGGAPSLLLSGPGTAGNVEPNVLTGYVDGMNTSVNGNLIDISPGTVRADDDSQMIASAATLSANPAVNGANGLDTGAVADNNWYAVMAIADSSGANPVASLLTLTPSAPTMPAGYDLKRRVGWARRESSAWVVRSEYQRGRLRDTWWDTATAGIILSSGSSLAWLTVTCDTRVPPTARMMIGNFRVSTSISPAAKEWATLRRESGSSNLLSIGSSQDVLDWQFVTCVMQLTSAQTMQYQVSDTDINLTIVALGYRDEL